MCVQGSQKIKKKEFPAARIKQQHIRLAKIEESESVAAVVALCALDFLDKRHFVQEDLLSHEYSPPRPSVSRTNWLRCALLIS